MKRIIPAMAFLSVSLLFTNNVNADIKKDITNCKQLKKDNGRLTCYDALAIHYLSVLNHKGESEIVADVGVKPEDVVPSASSIPIVIPSASTNKVLTKAQAEAKVISETEDFGQSSENKIQTIQSAMIGEFSSWKKGMKLHLENGQVWVVKANKSGYKRMSNPVITITRGFFGSFDAKVEGLNASTKVKRLK